MSNSINIPKIGMYTDKSIYNLEKGEYTFSLNSNIQDFTGEMLALQNEASNILKSDFNDFKVVGKKLINELNRTLFFLTNGTTSKIVEVVNNFYDDDKEDIEGGIPCCDTVCGINYIERMPLEKTTQTIFNPIHEIIEDDCLNFSINFPVEIEYKISNKGVDLYITDYNNDLRYLYLILENNELQIDNYFKKIIGYDSNNCNTPIYDESLDCNKIRVNPNYTTPCIKAINTTSGGSLKAGVYQALICYADSLSIPLTKYFKSSEPVSIYTKKIIVNTDYVTDESIVFEITNLDKTGVYSYYNIVIAETIENFTSFKLVATLPINQTNFIYSGNNVIKDLSSSDIFFERPIYKKAKTISSANDYLFIGNVKESAKLNLQQAVNKISAFWETKSLPENIYKDPITSSNYRGYMRDEVYPIGIVFEIFGDNDTVAFPLVGPSKEYFLNIYDDNVDEIINNNDVITTQGCNNITLNKKWQCYNTAKIVGTPHNESNGCYDNNIWEWGEFAYWESTEKYPNIPEIWGDLCGKPIRHFKFPDSSITHIHNNLNGESGFSENNRIFPIGIKVEHSSVVSALNWALEEGLITQEQRNSIKGYRIVRGNRVGNKSISAKGLLYDMWKYTKDNNTVYYPNYPYNDLNNDEFISNDPDTYNGSNNSNPIPNIFSKDNRYTFHSPDTHFYNTNLGEIIKLETEEYGKSEGFFNHCDNQPEYVLLSQTSQMFCFAYGIAAAMSSITKQCRTLEKATSKFPIYPEVSGAATAIVTIPLVSPLTEIEYSSQIPYVPDILLDYNGITPGPSGNIKKVSYQDCKGTIFHWLEPAHIAAMFPGNPTVASIMSAVAALTNVIGAGTYLLATAFKEMEEVQILIKKLTKKKNLTIQYNSTGKYNNYKIVLNEGNKQRLIEHSEYLTPNKLYLDNNDYINNWNRESSVYIKTSLLPNTTIKDNSRTTMAGAGLSYGDLNYIFNRDISSYYTSIKTFVPNQYGSIYNIDFLETSGCSTVLSNPLSITHFGGDTFINRFALKRKMPFFIQTRFNQIDQSDISYSELGNVGYPNYYFDAGEGWFEKLTNISFSDVFSNLGAILQDLFGTDDSRMDVKTSKLFYQNGYIHLYNYGIPYFLCESDINVDLRHAENITNKDFYPRTKNLGEWLQEKNVPISEDNYFFYNKTYSKQNKESFIKNANPKYIDYTKEKNVTYTNKVVYTDKTKQLIEHDSWLIYRSNNFYDFDKKDGKIISLNGIEQDKILTRCENISYIFNAYDIVKMETGSFQTSVGGIFESRPKNFVKTDLGYMGTYHKDILSTEYGHIWVDSERGNIFLLGNNGSGIEEISKNGMKNWFSENLPFTIKKYFPTIDIDNNYKGIGIALGFDRKFNRFFITKLDYRPLKSNIIYNNNKFYDGETEIFLNDSKYFCNKSWTIGYCLLTKTWISFYSFTPNYYISYINSFDTGINGITSNLWAHNITNKSYQVFYGKLHEFIVETNSEITPFYKTINSLSYITDVLRYHNQYDYFYNQYVTFNKAIIYNERQNSGLLILHPKNPNNLSDNNRPEIDKNGINIDITNSNNIWNINDFYDSVCCKENNTPIWNRDCNNVNKHLNLYNLQYKHKDLDEQRITGKTCYVRLINDKWSNYKFIFFLTSFNEIENIR